MIDCGGDAEARADGLAAGAALGVGLDARPALALGADSGESTVASPAGGAAPGDRASRALGSGGA
ncbi:MAG TPA: hypothetical protein VGM29_04215, partial [Polyangiaceae bacterium]